MAFLDNSGDIILDAVLTDAGRQRMARGNFKIVKFALGDDEINYELFNSNHPSGSAYYDLDIMQTPILEAFTNNTATMKSRLLTVARTDILYMPILKINEKLGGSNSNSKLASSTSTPANADSNGMFVVAASKATEDDLLGESDGVMFGVSTVANKSINKIVIDQGQDTSGDPPVTDSLDSDLVESQYIIQIDNRLGKIAETGNTVMAFSFVDDDDIATYYFGLNNSNIISSISPPATEDITQWLDDNTPFNGPLGTRLSFKIKASSQLRASSSLFTKLGGTTTVTVRGTTGAGGTGTATCYYIDSIVRVTGVTTGYSIDIPVRFARKV